MSEYHADITVVGGGIAGLWCAKELVDQGYRVNLVEGAEALATGATTRNEGWLHAGTYHAVGIDDYPDAEKITERTLIGHEEVVRFAPDAIETSESYAFVHSPKLVDEALRRWKSFGVQHQQIGTERFRADGFNVDRVEAAFSVSDKSVHSVALCRKLAEYLIASGGEIFTSASFHPEDTGHATIQIGSEKHRLISERFLVTAGTGIKQVVELATGQPLAMRYFKSHLLVAPLLSSYNCFFVDSNESGVMCHGRATIVGYNKDSIEVTDPNYEVVPEKERLVYNALVRLLPRAQAYPLESRSIVGVACVKPDATDNKHVADKNTRQDLNVRVFEPTDGYVCAIPGKMTEAPVLAALARDHILASPLRKPSHPSKETPLVIPGTALTSIKIAQRPMDIWLATEANPYKVSA